MEGIWVDIESKGKSSAIKQNQLGRLESEYNAAVGKIFGVADKNKKAAPATPPAKQTSSPSVPQNTDVEPSPEDNVCDFKVHSVKPSGKSSQLLELIDGKGEVVTAYIKASDQSIVTGSRLRGVQMEKKNSSFGEYNLINEYQLAA